MEHCRALSMLVVAVCVLAAILLVAPQAEGFNQDRYPNKWSPLFFNKYYRRGNLYKRFRDEPIQKWSPTYFGTPLYYEQDKKEGGSCGKENSRCSYVSPSTGQPMTVRCCGALQCIYTGASYTCADPKSYTADGDVQNYDYYSL